ncbi:MAG: hypothetical protein WA919_08145 [Coleofasciculaceae cyanobacterium]
MQLKTMKVLAGVTLSVLIPAVSVHAVMASNLGKPESEPMLISQVTQAGELAGEIVSIDGETVEFAQSNGQTRNITIPQGEINRLSLTAGSQIAVRLDAQGVATSVRVIRPVRALW